MATPSYACHESSVPDIYDLATEARDRLSELAAHADHNLRLIVGHALLLDTLTAELLQAKQRRMNEQRSLRKSSRAARPLLCQPPRVPAAAVKVETHEHDADDQLSAAPIRLGALVDGPKGDVDFVIVHDENILDGILVSAVDLGEEPDSDDEDNLGTPLPPAWSVDPMREHAKYTSGGRRKSVDSDSDSGFESCESDSDDEELEDVMDSISRMDHVNVSSCFGDVVGIGRRGHRRGCVSTQ